MYKGKFRRAFPESFLFFHSFFYALTAGRRRRDIIKGRSSERSFFMSARYGRWYEPQCGEVLRAAQHFVNGRQVNKTTGAGYVATMSRRGYYKCTDKRRTSFTRVDHGATYARHTTNK